MKTLKMSLGYRHNAKLWGCDGNRQASSFCFSIPVRGSRMRMERGWKFHRYTFLSARFSMCNVLGVCVCVREACKKSRQNGTENKKAQRRLQARPAPPRPAEGGRWVFDR